MRSMLAVVVRVPLDVMRYLRTYFQEVHVSNIYQMSAIPRATGSQLGVSVFAV